MILMLIGCLVPMLVIGALRYFNVGANGLAKYSSLLFLLCPLMHILMMVGMMGHGKNGCHEEKVRDKNNNDM